MGDPRRVGRSNRLGSAPVNIGPSYTLTLSGAATAKLVNGLAVVTFSLRVLSGGPTLSGITWNGTAMTQAAVATGNSGAYRTYIYYLIDPDDDGFYDVVASFGGTDGTGVFNFTATTYSNMAQSSVLDDVEQMSDQSGTNVVNVALNPTEADELCIACSYHDSSSFTSVSDINLYSVDNGSDCMAENYAFPASSGSKTLTHTYGASGAHCAVGATFKSIDATYPQYYTVGPGGEVDDIPDVNLNSSAPTYNGGIHAGLQFGTNNNGLMKFDLSGLSADMTVSSATLKLGLYAGSDDDGADIYSILVANDGWIEGTKDLALAAAGEPCWNAKAADGAGGITTAWAGGSNGCGVSGTDINATAIGELIAGTGAAAVHDVELDTAVVQTWLGGSAQNYGILIKPNSATSNHIALFEYATAAYRPKLVIVYTSGDAGVEVTPSAVSLEIATYDATISAAISFTADSAPLEIATYDATVSLAINIAADAAALEISTYDASVSVGVGVTASVAEFAITGNQANVSAAINVSAGYAELTITPNAASVSVGNEISVNVAGLELATHAPNISAAINVQADSASLTMVPYEAGVSSGNDIAVNVVPLTLTPYQANVSAAINVSVDSRALVISIYAAGVSAGIVINVGIVALKLTAYQAGIISTTNIQVLCRELFITAYVPSVVVGAMSLIPASPFTYAIKSIQYIATKASVDRLVGRIR